MTYNFKLNAFKQPVSLRLGNQSLEVLNEKQEVTRQIDLKRINKLREYNGLNAMDPNKGSYQVQYCKLYIADTGTLYIRNGSHLGTYMKIRDIATDQDEAFQRFLVELKRRTSDVNPAVKFTSGWLLAALLWWMLGLLGVGFLAFGVAAFFTDPIITALVIALFAIPVGIALIVSGVSLGRSYWPKRY